MPRPERRGTALQRSARAKGPAEEPEVILVRSLSVSGQGELRLTGVKGSRYEIQVRPDLSGYSVWSNAWTVTLSGEKSLLDYRVPTNPKSLFYRAVLKE